MPKKNKKPFKELQGAAVGIAGIGIATAVGASVAAKAPAGTPSLTGGFSTLAGFVPIATTAIGAKTVLKQLPKNKLKY